MRSYFNDDLVGAEFSGLEAAYKHMQIEALKAGFEVGCSQSFESVHGKIYCLKGGRKRGESLINYFLVVSENKIKFHVCESNRVLLDNAYITIEPTAPTETMFPFHSKKFLKQPLL